MFHFEGYKAWGKDGGKWILGNLSILDHSVRYFVMDKQTGDTSYGRGAHCFKRSLSDINCSMKRIFQLKNI